MGDEDDEPPRMETAERTLDDLHFGDHQPERPGPMGTDSPGVTTYLAPDSDEAAKLVAEGLRDHSEGYVAGAPDVPPEHQTRYQARCELSHDTDDPYGSTIWVGLIHQTRPDAEREAEAHGHEGHVTISEL